MNDFISNLNSFLYSKKGLNIGISSAFYVCFLVLGAFEMNEANASEISAVSTPGFQKQEQQPLRIEPADGKTITQADVNNLRELNPSSIIIPASVTEIDDYAFVGCRNLTTVVFENKSQLRKIGNGAFEFCQFESINIPANVTEIGFCAFSDCKNLTTVTFEAKSKLQKIGQSAFMDCGLQSIEIPANVMEIEPRAFENCTDLATVIFENKSKLKRIGACAFENCLLGRIKIPSTVSYIGEHAFLGCRNLTTVTFEPKSQLRTVGLITFDLDKVTVEPIEMREKVRKMQEHNMDIISGRVY